MLRVAEYKGIDTIRVVGSASTYQDRRMWQWPLSVRVSVWKVHGPSTTNPGRIRAVTRRSQAVRAFSCEDHNEPSVRQERS